jgi:hypothetical protein
MRLPDGQPAGAQARWRGGNPVLNPSPVLADGYGSRRFDFDLNH